jgi:alpha-glucoside transport system permease protein
MLVRPPELRVAGTHTPPPRVRISRLVRRVGRAAVRVMLVAIALLWLLPTVGLAVASFRTSADSSASGWWTAIGEPSRLTLANYARVAGDSRIGESLWNTVVITLIATVLVVFLGTLAAYALSWVDFPGREGIFLLVVALIVVPVQVAIIPDAAVFRVLGLYGGKLAVIIFHVAFGLPFAIFLLRTVFLAVPRELVEAARVDGARDWAMLWRIMVPIGWPAIASLAVFQFLWVWNDLLVSLVFATSDNAPITYALREQMRTFSSNADIIAPGAILSMSVPLIVFFAFQRYVLQGVLAGATK